MRSRAKYNKQSKSLSIGFVKDNMSVTEIENIPDFKSIVYSETVNSINDANKNNKKIATLFDINNSGNIHEIEKSNWIPALEKTITYFEKLEKYEKCVEISNLIKEINERLKQDNSSSGQPSKRKNSRKTKKEEGNSGDGTKKAI